MQRTIITSALLLLCNVFVTPCSAKSDKTYTANDPAIRYTGRTLPAKDGSVTFDWVGTYLDTRLTGGKLDIKLSETGTSYYNVFIDGELHNVVKATGKDTTITFVNTTDRRQRHITIQKRTEGEFGKTTLKQFILPAKGSLAPEPRTRTRHIEFIGNSLTCGFGVEGKTPDEPFKLETENCYYSFSNIIPRYFDADYSLIAHSGKGVVRNYGDSVRVSAVKVTDKMLNVFDEGANNQVWEAKTYQPDLVVINLGTNDFSLEPQPYMSEFIEHYTKMVNQIRQQYGADVPVLAIYCCTIPAPVFHFYEAALASINDPNLHLFKMQKDLLNPNCDYGAVMHPNRQGQLKFAQSLIPYISTLTGWELPSKTIK